jgi:ribose 5-phosphate isomerase A
MKAEEMKKMAAEAALSYVEKGSIVGVGTGSTVHYFIEALATMKGQIEGTVASSIATEQQLKAKSIPVYDLNSVNQVDVYIDGADEVNDMLYVLKGRGGALTREKIIAAAAKKFICIVDEAKLVKILGEEAPIVVEVIPMARSYVARQIVKMGGDPVYRENYRTDNNNIILDVYNLKIREPIKLEEQLKTIVGVVETGLFAKQHPQYVLVATPDGVKTLS